VPSLFAVLDAIFDEQHKRIIENPYGGLESDAVLFAVAAALVLVPLVPHRYTYRITDTMPMQGGLPYHGENSRNTARIAPDAIPWLFRTKTLFRYVESGLDLTRWQFQLFNYAQLTSRRDEFLSENGVVVRIRR